MRTGLRTLAAMLACGAMTPVAAWAQSAPFDLAGPALDVSVKRQGTSLPISRVPNLAVGDRLTIRADLPEDQSAHYMLVAVFLRGATNPPPKEWFFQAETWKRKEKQRILDITVPEGAHQIAVFLVPETGGDFATLTDAVRGRPGAFVRASQDLNQAMLDRSRLDAFLEGISRQDQARPEKLEEVSPVLARSLSMKLNAECLQKLSEVQASCLTQDREALVLNDIHTTSMTEALTGAPTDLAMQVAATRQGGEGYYSPYIGVVRDLARVLGAFHTAEFQYIPALGVTRDGSMHLLLNAVPSFREPKSVLVTALPPIKAPQPPPLQAAQSVEGLCASNPDLVLPVNGGPLIYSTSYAHSMVVSMRTKDGRPVSVPVRAAADKGGFVIDRGRFRPADYGPQIDAALQGYWGFQPFNGPTFRVANPDPASWKVADGQKPLVEGEGGRVALQGAATGCVESISVKLPSGRSQTVAWRPTEAGGVAFDLQGADLTPGDAIATIKLAGIAEPVAVGIRVESRPAPQIIVPSLAPAAVPSR